jgi:hypothetical protein
MKSSRCYVAVPDNLRVFKESLRGTSTFLPRPSFRSSDINLRHNRPDLLPAYFLSSTSRTFLTSAVGGMGFPMMSDCLSSRLFS